MITQRATTQASAQEQSNTDDTVLGNPRTDDTVTLAAKKRQEAEISRLTWAVLDGTATAAMRQRLADLVSEQHRARGE